MPRSKRPKRKISAITAQRNSARGLVSAAKDSRFTKTSNNKELMYRGRLNITLLNARENLPVSEYENYLNWLEKQNYHQIPGGFANSAQYKEWNWVPKAKALPLAQELRWIGSRLRFEQEKLSAFRGFVAQLELAVWSHDITGAEACLNNMEEEFGPSFWLADIRIGLAQLFHGLELQKRIKNVITEIAKKGPVSFIVHNIGIRNEPSGTIKRFNEQIIERLKKADISEALRLYYQFRLTKELPASAEDLSTLLRVEQSHSAIDLYETFISIAQRIVSDDRHQMLKPALLKVIRNLPLIADPRLDKILSSLGEIRSDLKIDEQANELLHKFYSGDLKNAYRHSASKIRSGNPNLTDFIVMASILPITRKSNLRGNEKLANSLLKHLSEVLTKGDEFEAALTELEKITTNLDALPTIRALGQIYKRESTPLRFENISLTLRARLNDTNVIAEDLAIASGTAQAKLIELCSKLQSKLPFITLMRQTGKTPAEDSGNPVLELADCMHFLANSEPELAVEKLSRLRSLKLPRFFDFTVSQLLVEAYLQGQDFQSAYQLIAEEVLKYDFARHVLPIKRAVKLGTWRHWSQFTDKLCLTIVLDLYLREHNDYEIATALKAASGEFLSKHHLELPTQIIEKLNDFNKTQVIYYLRHVCVISVLEMLPTLTQSQDAELERKNIYTALINLDSDNAITYENECYLISRKITLAEGLRLVDQTRVYVDEESILKWAAKNLKENYRRYKDLVEAGVGVATESHSSLLQAAIAANSLINSLQVPENEADDLLISMFRDVREQFLQGDEHGLNVYLSRRIRHNTMHNILRKPLDEAKLITQRDKAGGHYQENTHWVPKLAAPSEAQQLKLFQHFRAFSEEFDAVIIDLKDSILQVKSAEFPQGIFEIIISPVLIIIAKGYIQEHWPSLEDLVKLYMRFFWQLLQSSLTTATKIIEKDTKTKIADVFARLRHRLGEDAVNDMFYASLSQSIGDAHALVNAELDKVAGWFHQTSTASGAFPLSEMLDFAITSATAPQGSYEPIVNVEIAEGSDVILDIGALGDINDVISIALNNVFMHSNIENAPKMLILASIERASKLLQIIIQSDVASGVRTQVIEDKLAIFRAQIQDGTYKIRLSKEGGTGLKKLAAIVAKHSLSSLDFGFTSNTQFQIKIAIAVAFPDESKTNADPILSEAA